MTQRCGHCSGPAVMRCDCPRCQRELIAGERDEVFYACATCRADVEQSHYRIRGRHATWKPVSGGA